MQNSQNKTVHEVKTEETSGLVPMSLITSALHSLPPSCKAPYFSCLHKSVTHPQTFGTDWIASCRSRFYLTVAKVPLFHCYDILKLAQLVLLLGHCLGSFMTHDMLWSSCDDPTCQASILQEACTTSSGAKTARGLECLECLWSTVDIQAMRADADSSAQMRLSGADFRLYCTICR